MEYVLRLRWAGLHGDVSLGRSDDEPLYTVKVGALDVKHQWNVVGPDGQPVFDIENSGGGLGTKYKLRRKNRVLGEVSSGLWWSQGHIHLKDFQPVHCRYGWGLKRKLPLQGDDEQPVGELELQGGLSARGKLHIADESLDAPAFQVACMLIFRDWTSR